MRQMWEGWLMTDSTDGLTAAYEAAAMKIAYGTAISDERIAEYWSDLPQFEKDRYLARARAVVDAALPLITQREDRLAAALERVRALATEFENDGIQRWGGNIAWHIREEIHPRLNDNEDAALRSLLETP